jgi:hypothetical protein
MVDIEVTDTSAIFHVQGLDKLWAVRSSLELPLRHIRAVRIEPEAARGWWHGLRLPGTNVPGVISAGTFYQAGKRVFWDVHNPEQTIIIEVQHDRYDEVVIEVRDPEYAAARLRAAVAHQLEQFASGPTP